MNAKLKTIALVRLKLKRRYRVYMDRGVGDDLGGMMLVEATRRAGERHRAAAAVLGYRGDAFIEQARPEFVSAPYIPLIVEPPDRQSLLDNSEFAQRAARLARHGVQRTECHIVPRFFKVYKGPGYPTDPKLQEERDRAHLFSVLPW